MVGMEMDVILKYKSGRIPSGVSRVWQVGHVPCAPLEGGATKRFWRLMFPYGNVLKMIF